MKENSMSDDTSVQTTEDMLADLGVSGAEADQLRAVLGAVAGLASDVPEPSDDVRVLLGGAIPLRPRRHLGIVAAAVGALAFGGFSAAAAANRLPDPIQEVVADVTDPLPVKAPHPVKPVNPPFDAPGHVLNKPKATKTPKPEDTTTPKPLNTTAPGQIQKLTKPDPKAPGPARPADPGSHGRLHQESNVNGADKVRTDRVKADRADSDDSDDGDSGGNGGSGSAKGKSK